MNNRKKMIVGIASLAGAACAAGVTAKVTDCIKRKWFSQGYDAGHLLGFMDGGIAMAKKYDNVVKSASEAWQKSLRPCGEVQQALRGL